MPDLEVNLLSVLKLTGKGARVVFKEEECIIERDGKVVATAQVRGGQYYLRSIYSTARAMQACHQADCIHE